jgi:hypothetical protein
VVELQRSEAAIILLLVVVLVWVFPVLLAPADEANGIVGSWDDAIMGSWERWAENCPCLKVMTMAARGTWAVRVPKLLHHVRSSAFDACLGCGSWDV